MLKSTVNNLASQVDKSSKSATGKYIEITSKLIVAIEVVIIPIKEEATKTKETFKKSKRKDKPHWIQPLPPTFRRWYTRSLTTLVNKPSMCKNVKLGLINLTRIVRPLDTNHQRIYLQYTHISSSLYLNKISISLPSTISQSGKIPPPIDYSISPSTATMLSLLINTTPPTQQ